MRMMLRLLRTRRLLYQGLQRGYLSDRPADWWPEKPEIPDDAADVHFTVLMASGKSQIELEGKEGQSIEDVLKDQGLIEAACDGNCQCSTCHVFVPKTEDREKLPIVEDFELDMLELASEYEKDPDASRLSCQLILSPKLEGIQVRLPMRWTNYMDHIPLD